MPHMGHNFTFYQDSIRHTQNLPPTAVGLGHY